MAKIIILNKQISASIKLNLWGCNIPFPLLFLTRIKLRYSVLMPQAQTFAVQALHIVPTSGLRVT